MSIEVIEVSPHISVPQAGSTVAGEVFRQLLQQAIRVADQANSQSVRMATDFAEVYRREQSVRLEYETKLREMRLLERQSTRYAEDLADMLRKERERREELETALESERIANEERPRTGLGAAHPMERRATASRSPRASCPSPTSSTPSRRSGRTRPRGRSKRAWPRSSPARARSSIPRSSLSSSRFRPTEASSASGRRSRPRSSTEPASGPCERPTTDRARHARERDEHRQHAGNEPIRHRRVSRDEVRDGALDDEGADRAADQSCERARERTGARRRAVVLREVAEDEIDDGAREQAGGGQHQARAFEARWSDRLRELLRTRARLDRSDRDEQDHCDRCRGPRHVSSSSPRMKVVPMRATSDTAPTKSHAAQKPKV